MLKPINLAAEKVSPEMVDAALSVYLCAQRLSPEQNPIQLIVRRMLEAALANHH